MNEIEVKREPVIRVGESGTIVLGVPKTAGYKSLTIDVPPGVESTSGSSIFVSGGTVSVDIPLLVTSKAPQDIINIIFGLEEIKDDKKKSIKFTKKYSLKIQK